MTVAAAKRAGFAVAVKGMFGWQADCPTCPWSSLPGTTEYKGDAAWQAREHNARVHAQGPVCQWPAIEAAA